MSDSGENSKYKWTPESTTLLVSVWTDKQVQKQLEYSTKPQLIWESVARYMRKKGYNVTSKQCRSRMKQVLVCYREAKRAGTRAGVEQYYESIDKVLQNKRLDHVNVNGVDTVDSSANVKSPPKDVKTNKNLRMQYRYHEPIESLLRTEALSPTWEIANEEDYPESPESNETVLAQPYRGFSPVRDVATNTIHQLTSMGRKSVRQNSLPLKESSSQETYRQNSLQNNRFSEVPYQNTVQNVQNQIIQENMQQNLLEAQNQLFQYNLLQGNPIGFQQNVLGSANQDLQNRIQHGVQIKPPNKTLRTNIISNQNPILRNTLRMQNQLQQSSIVNNQALPQEPRKTTFRQNLAATYKQYQDAIPSQCYNSNVNQIGPLSPSYSSDIAPNLNDAFCQTPNNEKSQNLNETFEKPLPMYNPLFLPGMDVSTLTNNATYNDDTLSIEFLQDSPTPSDSDNAKTKDFAANTDSAPDAPFRKKKAQKLEQLMLSAISSQNEVVNKILSAQNDMVTRFLDLDRDRQNRLENRLDHLLNVVHTTVLNKSSEKEPEIPLPPPEPLITCLVPPPKPGTVPPKLDLVPPKPCRVPCTIPSVKIDLVNQNPVLTKPGIVSPITSPSRKLGPIWSKLGPVSQSPFVRAQLQLGLRPATNLDTRTQSSAERRIAKQTVLSMDVKSLILETVTFLEMERRLEEKIENARLQTTIGQELIARKRLFTQREPSAATILTIAFLDAERQATEVVERAQLNWAKDRIAQMRTEFLHNQPTYDFTSLKLNEQTANRVTDEVLNGNGDTYECLRQLNIQCEPMNASTPLKSSVGQSRDTDEQQSEKPKQTIQQLAQLIMNSARWRNAATQNQQNCFGQNVVPSNFRKNENVYHDNNSDNARYGIQQNDYSKPSGSIKDRYSYNGQTVPSRLPAQAIENNIRLSYNDPIAMTQRHMGFTTDKLNDNNTKENDVPEFGRQMGFVDNGPSNYKQQNVRFSQDVKGPFDELQQVYAQRNHLQSGKNEHPPFMSSNGNVIEAQNQNMIKQYVQDIRRNSKGKETDSDNDEEFLDTTMSMPSSSSRKGSITSTSTAGTATSVKSGKSNAANCMIS